MAIGYLTDVAREKSTLVINTSLVDENGDPVLPTAATWTLTTADGTIVNSRDQVAFSPMATSMDIALEGDDLAILGTDKKEARIFTIEALYTSDFGANQKLKDSVIFYIDNLVPIT